MNALGKHLLLELKDCNPALLNDIEFLRKFLPEAAMAGGATVVGESFHQFKPHGISGVVIIAESHVFIHTWPECGYAAVDIFTCGNTVDPEKTAERVIQKLGAKSYSILEIHRGIVDGQNNIQG